MVISDGSALIQHVGVIGGGIMGSGIAEVCARGGSTVLVVEPETASWERLSQKLRVSLSKRPANVAAQDVINRVRHAKSLTELAGCSLVIEALPEIPELKSKVLADAATLMWPEAILASNTSSIPLAELASNVARPERFLGVHFFNPAPIMELVEIVPTLLTSEDVVDAVSLYIGRTLGKVTIQAPDRAGFIVNALLVPYLLAAARMYESGVATREDIDIGMVSGCNHPMGPLRLMDMIGLDVIAGVAQSLYAEFGEPSYLSPPLLRRMVQAGLLGRKSGRGFYEYP